MGSGLVEPEALCSCLGLTKMLSKWRYFPARKTELQSRTLQVRKYRVIFSVATFAVVVAVITTMLRTSLFILAQHIAVFQVDDQVQTKALASHVDLLAFSVQSLTVGIDKNAVGASTEQNQNTTGVEHDYAGNKLILVLDLWERMINVQSGLRRLVQLGVASGFTVVEPFVYESKVSPKFAFPENFEERNMTPQTAALYFRTEDLYLTNRYISHDQFKEKTLMGMSKSGMATESLTPSSYKKSNSQYLIQAVVFIDWSKSRSGQRNVPKSKGLPFYWCDERLKSKKWEKSTIGYLLAQNFHVQRALCLSSKATVAPARFGPRLFQQMFAFVKKGAKRLPQSCEKCVTLAFMNYRKHAFTGFVSHTGSMPFKQKTPPLEVGAVPQALAERMRTELLGGKPYLAIQLRTGKAFVLLEKYEKRLLAEGINITRHDTFKVWLGECTRQLVLEARKVGRELGPRAVFYIASDMYNDGWKGGEKCPPAVREALETAKSFLDHELKRVRWFNPKDFDVTQDAMGISGLADAAMCLKADRFIFAVPSNFGKWIHEQRAPRNKGAGTRKVDCTDPRFEGEY